ncbi:MAG: sigma-70 family RNA polymerase sigma factor [Acidobacteriota bacterium]|nr:sigma-70 family RNA polymerase sigma factor [Acidobacteriota bacterium]
MHADLSFEQVVRDHQEMVFRTLTRLTGTRDHVEDLAQEVFLRLYRALPSFRGESLVSTYLYRITLNVAQDEWKRRKREDSTKVSLSDEVTQWEDRLEHPSLNAEQQLEEREFQLSVEEQLQRLSQVERAILVLYHQEERTYAQIAHVLSLPIGTVRTHLHRGRKKLREAIQQQQANERRTPCLDSR